MNKWLLATRPWSFPASSMSVVVTTAFLFFDAQKTNTNINWINALLALVMMVFFQAAGNCISDYYDNKKQVDLPGSSNGVSWIYDGTFRPKQILSLGLSLLGVATLIGVVLLFLTSIELLWIGLCGVVLSAFYPWLKYHALGDYNIFLCYAILPALGTSYVVVGELNYFVLLLSFTYGLITVAILHANNTRDIQNDGRAGIRTLAMQIGTKASKILYAMELLLPYALILTYVLQGYLPIWSLLSLLMIPLSYNLVKVMMNAGEHLEQDIATLDQKTAQLQLQFSLFMTLILLVTGVFR